MPGKNTEAPGRFRHNRPREASLDRAGHERLQMAEDKINKDMIIGIVMETYPATAAVFRKHFRTAGCLTCPGARREDIAFGALMHNAKLDKLLAELNAVVDNQEETG
jgi:hybrid cluster-associated redox disulfide protein